MNNAWDEKATGVKKKKTYPIEFQKVLESEMDSVEAIRACK